MLRFLRIRNLAVIEAVEVEFEPGFNVLTGETGAGKSILVEAVGLLLGAAPPPISSGPARRRPRSKPSSKTATDGELIVRREITSQGRSRSFINGALATAAALRDLSERLVELHGQHEHQALLDPLTHLPLLDDYAGARAAAAADVATAWRSVRTLREQLDRVAHGRPREGGAARSDRVPARRDREGRAASRARTRSSPPTEAGARQRRARSSGCARRVYAALYDSDDAVLAGLGGVWKRVGELATIDPQFAPYARGARRHQVAARGPGLLPSRATPTASTRRPAGCSRSRIGLRCSSA